MKQKGAERSNGKLYEYITVQKKKRDKDREKK